MAFISVILKGSSVTVDYSAGCQLQDTSCVNLHLFKTFHINTTNCCNGDKRMTIVSTYLQSGVCSFLLTSRGRLSFLHGLLFLFFIWQMLLDCWLWISQRYWNRFCPYWRGCNRCEGCNGCNGYIGCDGCNGCLNLYVVKEE